MCLLIFRFGDAAFPFVLCSNRDEALFRKTTRGAVSSIKSARFYAPKDKDAGGTWIAFSETNSKFAVILNYHEWRCPSKLLVSFFHPSSGTSKKSRGCFPLEFVSGEESADEYARRVSSLDEYAYAGFNLIIGDINGCYYVSNQYPRAPPLQLQPQVTYGISNGTLNDEWCKVSIARRKVSAIIDEHTNVNDAPYVEGARILTASLMTLMHDKTPLMDPTFGYLIPHYCNVSAICVKPLFFDNGKLSSVSDNFGTRTTTIAVLYKETDISCPRIVDQDRFKLLITENDLDPESALWSTREHHINYQKMIL